MKWDGKMTSEEKKVTFDLSTIPIQADSSHVDEDGNPRSDALIYEDRIVCHPDHEEKLREAIRLFFPQQNAN